MDPTPSAKRVLGDVDGPTTIVEIAGTEPGDALVVVRIPEAAGIDPAKLLREIDGLLDDAGAPHHAIRKVDFDLGDWLDQRVADQGTIVTAARSLDAGLDPRYVEAHPGLRSGDLHHGARVES